MCNLNYENINLYLIVSELVCLSFIETAKFCFCLEDIATTTRKQPNETIVDNKKTKAFYL